MRSIDINIYNTVWIWDAFHGQVLIEIPYTLRIWSRKYMDFGCGYLMTIEMFAFSCHRRLQFVTGCVNSYITALFIILKKK